jgi:hypothetical protein
MYGANQAVDGTSEKSWGPTANAEGKRAPMSRAPADLRESIFIAGNGGKDDSHYTRKEPLCE